MKKIIVFTLVLIIMASLCACRKENNTQTTAATETQAPSTEPVTIPSMPDMTMPSSNIPDPTVDSNSGNPETEPTEK